MIDLRRVVVAFMLVAMAGTAVAQDRPGRGGGDRPNHQEQSQQGGADHEQGGPGVLSLLPADAVSRPLASWSFGVFATTFAAPRILNDPIGWRLSSFKKISCSPPPLRWIPSVLSRTSGVRMAIPAMFRRASLAVSAASRVIGIHNKFTNLKCIPCIQ